MINSNQSFGKQHFTICHELYHLFIQDDFTFMTCSVGRFDKRFSQIEYYADVFAAHLLMPKDGILELVPPAQTKKDKITLDTILSIEHYFSCSRRALLYRLHSIGLISRSYGEQFTNQITRGAALSGFPATLYKPANDNLVIGDYGKLAREMFDKNIISESHYLNLLNDIGINLSEEDLSDEIY